MFAAALDPLRETFASGAPAASSLAEENLQARIRGMLLMALSNRFGAIVLTTGNKSEMAVGYATLYGDMAGAVAGLNAAVKPPLHRLAPWHHGQAARPLS